MLEVVAEKDLGVLSIFPPASQLTSKPMIPPVW